MMVGPLEGQFLKMLVHMTGARRILEIGMFTGYSTLAWAEALPKDGSVVTCESVRKTRNRQALFRRKSALAKRSKSSWARR